MIKSKVSTSPTNIYLALVSISIEFLFLILSPQMFKLCPNAFFLYLMGHFILNCIFNVDDFLIETILNEDYLDEEIPVWRFWLAVGIAFAAIYGILYVLFRSPSALIIELLFEISEQGVKAHKSSK